MKKIYRISEFVEHVIADGSLPVHLEILGPHEFSLIGIASSRESMYGAAAKLLSAHNSGQIPRFKGVKAITDALNSWEGGGGGFSGGGASGSW
ncbi:MAG: hypothetical protein QM805_14240 [Pseudomonas sp.]